MGVRLQDPNDGVLVLRDHLQDSIGSGGGYPARGAACLAIEYRVYHDGLLGGGTCHDPLICAGGLLEQGVDDGF